MTDMKRCGWVVVDEGVIIEYTASRTRYEAIAEYDDGQKDELLQYRAQRRMGLAKLIPVYYNPEDLK